MDRLEKDWFDLIKDQHRLLPPPPPLTHEESVCAICFSGECENCNAIVFCDGCNLGVHQECYGVPYIPEGQWLCRKCMIRPEKKVRCLFCPMEGGAFKQTTTNEWAHLLCALWIPEVTIANPVYMEPVEGVANIPKSRWKLTCFLCKQRTGACIQCFHPSCFTAFHVTCARKAGLYMKVKHFTTEEGEQTLHKACCPKHAPRSYRPHAAAMNVRVSDPGQDSEEDGDGSGEEAVGGGRSGRGRRRSSPAPTAPTTTTTAPTADHTDPTLFSIEHFQKEFRAHQKKKNHSKTAQLGYDPSHPIAPEYLYQRLLRFLEEEKIGVRQRQKVVGAVCRYWALKRASRRGAPLLKRLHLEPWTAYSSVIRQNEALQIERFKILTHLRADLEKVRLMADLVRKREKEKLKILRLQMEYVYITLAPLHCLLRRSLEEARKLDKHGFFAEPVPVSLAPDYYDIIATPMDFATVQRKVEHFEYASVEAFAGDLRLIAGNALLYNKPETVYAKAAQKLQTGLEMIVENAEASWAVLNVEEEGGYLMSGLPSGIFEYPAFDMHAASDAGGGASGSSSSHLRPPVPLLKPVPKKLPITFKPEPLMEEAEESMQDEEERTAEKRRSRFWEYVEVAEEDRPPAPASAESVAAVEGRKRRGGGESVSASSSTLASTSVAESPRTSLRRKRQRTEDEETAPTSLDSSSAGVQPSSKKIKPHPQKVKAAASSSSSASSSQSGTTAPLQVHTRPSKRARPVQKASARPIRVPNAPVERVQWIAELHQLRQKELTKAQHQFGGEDNLVWAKQAGFPWFPAELISNHEPVPNEVSAKQSGGSFLGRFFDRDLDGKRTWVFMTSETGIPFDYGLGDVAKLQAARRSSPSMRSQIALAYRVGCESRGIDPSSIFSKAGFVIEDS